MIFQNQSTTDNRKCSFITVWNKEKWAQYNRDSAMLFVWMQWHFFFESFDFFFLTYLLTVNFTLEEEEMYTCLEGSRYLSLYVSSSLLLWFVVATSKLTAAFWTHPLASRSNMGKPCLNWCWSHRSSYRLYALVMTDDESDYFVVGNDVKVRAVYVESLNCRMCSSQWSQRRSQKSVYNSVKCGRKKMWHLMMV